MNEMGQVILCMFAFSLRVMMGVCLFGLLLLLMMMVFCCLSGWLAVYRGERPIDTFWAYCTSRYKNMLRTHYTQSGLETTAHSITPHTFASLDQSHNFILSWRGCVDSSFAPITDTPIHHSPSCTLPSAIGPIAHLVFPILRIYFMPDERVNDIQSAVSLYQSSGTVQRTLHDRPTHTCTSFSMENSLQHSC